jgi:SAM-dependent methyltransferase
LAPAASLYTDPDFTDTTKHVPAWISRSIDIRMAQLQHDHANEIAYTFGYCDELNPLRAKLPLLNAGFEFPTVRNACELGFGHGISVNIHAAGSTAQWYGTDANPTHAGFASQLAEEARTRPVLSSQRFAEFCGRDDLPDFEFIGLHGVWSWISDVDRATVIDFVRRKLKAGGVLYVSYNTQPGWSPMLPVRELMLSHFAANAEAVADRSEPVTQTTTARLRAAIGFAQRVLAARPGYALVNPSVTERVRSLSEADPSYIAHEYFSREWYPTSFFQVASSLELAELSYVGSADYRDHIDAINLSADQRSLLAEIGDVRLRETVRDLCMNRSFRRDYWVKRPRRFTDDERREQLREHRVILPFPQESVALKVRGALGETALPEALYRPILHTLSKGSITTLREIEAGVRKLGITFEQVIEAVMLLAGTGVLFNVQDDRQINLAQPTAEKLNAAVCERAYGSDTLSFLVSPVSASGVFMPRLAQVFLLATLRGLSQPRQWAEFAHTALDEASTANLDNATSNGRLPPDSPLLDKAIRFAATHLPILRALGIVASDGLRH